MSEESTELPATHPAVAELVSNIVAYAQAGNGKPVVLSVHNQRFDEHVLLRVEYVGIAPRRN